MIHGCLRRLGFACAVVFLAAVASCGGAQSRLASHLERGKQFLGDANYQKAGVEFRNVLQIDPRNVEAHVLSGHVAERAGDYQAAVGSYRAALSNDENSVSARAAIARIMLFAGEPAKALELLEPGLTRNPQEAELLSVRAATRLAQKDKAGALADSELAHKVAPLNEDAVAILAALYQQDKELARAEALVLEAIGRNPKSVDLRDVLASMYAGADEGTKAEVQLREVIKLRPNELARRTRLAVYLTRANRLDDAQQVLADAVRELPTDDLAKVQLADFIASQRSRQQGEKALREFIAANQDNGDLRLGLGALLQRAGATDEAVAVYRELIGRDGDSPKSLVALDRIAAIQIASGKIADAQKTIDAVLKKNPRDLDALTLRGNLALERNDPEAAIADLRTVLREQPQSPVVRRALARAHIANGEPALAEDTLREALRQTPNDAPTRIDLAQLLTQTKRAGQAVTLLEETVRQFPADGAAREMLVRAYIVANDLPAARTAAEDLKSLRADAAAGPYLAGLIAQAQKRPDDARHELKRAIELQPDAMDAQVALTGLDLAQGKSADAEKRIRALLDRAPHNPIARNLLGELLLAKKAYREAAEQFARAIADEPKWPVPYGNLATAKRSLGDQDGALSTYETGVMATNYAGELVFALAAAYERQGKADAAIALYDALVERQPRAPAFANNLAMLLASHRTDKASLDRAKQLTASFAASDQGELLDTSGWVRLKAGDVDDALPLLERAASRAPESRVVRYHLAMAQIEAGQHDKARDNLENVLEDDTQFSGREAARAALDRLKRRSS